MTFGDAMNVALGGGTVRNVNWNGANMSVKAQIPDSWSKMTAPYMYMEDAQGNLVPWQPSQQDMFSNNWIVV